MRRPLLLGMLWVIQWCVMRALGGCGFIPAARIGVRVSRRGRICVSATPPSIEDLEKLFNETFEGIRADMRANIKPLLDMSGKIESDLEAMKGDLSSMQKLTSIDRSMDVKLQQESRYAIDYHLRPEIRRRFGEGYEEKFIATSIQGLVSLLPPETGAEAADVYVTRYWRSETIAKALVRQKVPLRLMRQVQEGCSRSLGEEVRFINDDGTLVSETTTEGILTRMGDKSLTSSVRFLRECLKCEEEKSLMVYLLSEGTAAGVMCVVAAAHPKLYLENIRLDKSKRGGSKLVLPSKELDFNCRGEHWLGAGKLMGFEVGQVSMGVDYSTAVPQLGICLKVLKWLAQTSEVERDGPIRLHGRIFVPAYAVGPHTYVDEKQVDIAKREWAYMLSLELL